MPNIFHEVKTVNVSPFWGDSMYDIGITRADFSINYKYTPTAIFFGSIHAASGGLQFQVIINIVIKLRLKYLVIYTLVLRLILLFIG